MTSTISIPALTDWREQSAVGGHGSVDEALVVGMQQLGVHVRQVFTTRHAVGLVGDNGVVLLIHIGLGTVKLKGTGFVSYVEEGQKVKKGQELIEFWDPTIKKAGLDDTVIVVATNSNEFENIKLTAKAGTEVKAEDEVMTLAAKEKVEAK